MAKETRRFKRAGQRPAEPSGKERRAQLKEPMLAQPGAMPDPLSRGQLKSMVLRLGIPVLAVWLICLFIFGLSYSNTLRTILLVVPSVITLAVVVLVLWALRQAKKARGVAQILSQVKSSDDRKTALGQLETSFKKKDPAAIFARAQLEMQDDPERALATLEQIDLNKVMAPVADEARTQRAMIHLTLGQVSQARQLVDSVELKRHQDAKTRALMAAVVAEALARSGAGKRALDTLKLFNLEDEEFAPVRPQLYRALAYAAAHASDAKLMRRALRKLLDQDVRLLGSFLMKKTHPLLQKEAKKLLEQSGQVPRKMQIQRRP